MAGKNLGDCPLRFSTCGFRHSRGDRRRRRHSPENGVRSASRIHASSLRRLDYRAGAADLWHYAVSRLADGMGRFLARRSVEVAAAVVRLVATGVGYLLVLIAAFELLGVSIAHLIIGFGLAGVVLGIAAQQSLGNISPPSFCSSLDLSMWVSTSVFARARSASSTPGGSESDSPT